jgi:hypothetical protein
MTASLTFPRHKYACVMSSSSRLDRRADLAGRLSCDLHPTISMTHPALHGFRPFRGTGTASIDLKLRIQLATINQRPLYTIMLDLHKTYDSLHWERTLEILRSYGVGPNVIRLKSNYWASQMTVVRQGGYHSGEIHVARGVIIIWHLF